MLGISPLLLTRSDTRLHAASAGRATQAGHMETNQLQRAGLLLLCTAGIYAAYLTQGLVQEHLQLKRYGPAKERFTHLESLMGAQSLVCFVWAYILVLVQNRAGGKQLANLPPWTAYWRPALTNAVGPALGMLALKNISYPAQVLAKSCKMVPVMVMGTVLHRKRYSPLEYICMSVIGLGVALFARSSSSKVTKQLANPNAPLGYLLCFLNLTLDGYTNAAQDEINRKHPDNSPVHMMCWMNFWGALYYGAYLAATGIGRELVAFCLRHPDAAWDVALFCVCGAFGQLVIFATIKAFGSLINTLVCTTRKFFNILGSVVLNGNPLLPAQWVAVCMVFSGLITSTLSKRRRPHAGASKQH